MPRVQFVDRVVDDPDCIKKRRKAEGQDQDVDVEVRRLGPSILSTLMSRFGDLVLPSSQSCLCVSIASSDGEEEELKHQPEATSLVQGREHRRKEDETDAQVPGSELVQVAPNMGAGGSHPQATMDQGWDKELREIRRMIEFLVKRERKLDVRTDVAARRLERLERGSSQLEDEERETSLGEALADRTKVVKLTVDKWLPLVRSSSSTPASYKARRYSWSVLTHGRKSSATMLVLREGIEPERRGARERGRRKRTERGQAERRSK